MWTFKIAIQSLILLKVAIVENLLKVAILKKKHNINAKSSKWETLLKVANEILLTVLCFVFNFFSVSTVAVLTLMIVSKMYQGVSKYYNFTYFWLCMINIFQISINEGLFADDFEWYISRNVNLQI